MKRASLPVSRISLTEKLFNPTMLVYLVALGIILAAMAYYGQLVSPYLAHDDWNFLLPASWGKGYATPWHKTLSEGRWLNYWWYLLIGVRWSATAAVWADTLFAALFACALSVGVEGPLRKLLLILVIFFSPVFAELSVWPAALTASRLLLAVSVLSFSLSGHRRQKLALGLATFLAVMSYAGAAPIILLAYVFLKNVAQERELVATVAVYLAAYALSILCIATLNYFYHDHFGLIIENWRRPHPAHDLASFWANCSMQLEHLRRSASFLLWPLLVSAASALMVSRYGPRKLLVSIMAVAVMAFTMDLCLGALNGIAIPVRAMGWLWVSMAMCVFLVWDLRDTRLGAIGYLGAVAMLLIGFTQWGFLYRSHKPAGNYIYAVGAALSHVAAGRNVVLVGDAQSIPQLRHLYNDPQMQLRMAWFGIFGIQSSSCSEPTCAELIDYARGKHIKKLIFPYRDMEVVYFRHAAVFP